MSAESNMNSIPTIARQLVKALLLIAAVLLQQQVFAVNMAYHSLALNDKDARWQADSADYLIRQAALAVKPQPEVALKLAKQALLEKPVDARAYLYAGLAYDTNKKSQQAEQMMRYAHRFGPRMTDNQLQLADFWARQGDTVQALTHLSAAMEMRYSLQATLFPLLLQLAESQAMVPAFQAVLAEPPKWWLAFFNHALRHADDTVINSLFVTRELAGGAAPKAERQLYLDYLIRQHKSVQAYALWLEHLTPEQLEVLGYVNDGSFQLPASGEGFGWRFHHGRGVLLSRFEGTGTLSSPSLRIGFYGGRLASQELVSQMTMLEPGRYQFISMFKAESLNAGEGVKWKMTCSNGMQLGSGKLLTGTQNWSEYAFSFEVPDSAPCSTQKLVLITTPGGSRPFDYEGYAWFDEVKIENVEYVP
jgi:hypothetical protein